MGIARCKVKVDVENVPHGECDGCGHTETAAVLEIGEDWNQANRWSPSSDGPPRLVARSYMFRGLREVRDIDMVLCPGCEALVQTAARASAAAVGAARRARVVVLCEHGLPPVECGSCGSGGRGTRRRRARRAGSAR